MLRPALVMTCALASVGAVATTAQATAGSAAQPAIDRVVTLGDSFSSGSGIHHDASSYDDHGPETHSFDRTTRLGSSACERELDDTPGPRLAARHTAESVFVACAGAVIRELPAQIDAADIPGDGSGTLITVTIGGNDLRTGRDENWPDALVRCITSAGCHRSARNRVANLDEIRRDLTEAYVGIGEQYPDITVRALGYPRLMQSDRWCEGVTGISRAEADFIDEQVDELNRQIERASAAARSRTGSDIRYVSVVDEFAGHGACRFWQRDRYVNDLVFGDTLRRRRAADGTIREHWSDGPLNVSTASFHPSRKGYDAVLDALDDSIASHD